MRCPACKRPKTSVINTIVSLKTTSRTRECECGFCFSSTERLDKGWGFVKKGIFRGKLTQAMRDAVIARDDGKCRYCGESERLGIDHVIPFAAPVRDGWTREQETVFRNSADNMVACCERCNSSKGDRMPVVAGSNGQQPATRGVSDSDLDSSALSDPERARAPEAGEVPKFARVCKKNYSTPFEECWFRYGRKEEKAAAYGRFMSVAKAIGDENRLRDLILNALEWQGPIWDPDGWKYAPYFERYLKRRKWEDEPPPKPIVNVPRKFFGHYCEFHRTYGTRGKLPPVGYSESCSECRHAAALRGVRKGEPVSVADIARVTEQKLAEYRALKPASVDELAELRAARKGGNG